MAGLSSQELRQLGGLLRKLGLSPSGAGDEL
jgi:hypothetical protein